LAQFSGDIQELVQLKRRNLEETAAVGELNAGDLYGLITWAELHELGLEDGEVSAGFLGGLARLAMDRLDGDARERFLINSALDIFRLRTHTGDLEAAERALKWAKARSPASHRHDTIYADHLMLQSSLDRRRGRVDEAFRKVDEAAAIGRSMLEIDPEDLRARFIVATAPARRALIYRGLGDRKRELEELEKSLPAIRRLLEDSDGNFLVKRRLTTALLYADRIEEARPLVADLIEKGYRQRRLLELAAARGVLPDPLPPPPHVDRSIPPRLQAAFDAVAHLELPWESDEPAAGL
ncbi:MAG: hypothetical protein AAFY88_12940, partial [Acidobacteriota bacterium]